MITAIWAFSLNELKARNYRCPAAPCGILAGSPLADAPDICASALRAARIARPPGYLGWPTEIFACLKNFPTVPSARPRAPNKHVSMNNPEGDSLCSEKIT
jgi:hypothetical protein